MISVSDLCFCYPGGEFELDVPKLNVSSGEKLAVIGPSGSEKTTLRHLTAGILTILTARFAPAVVRVLLLQ